MLGSRANGVDPPNRWVTHCSSGQKTLIKPSGCRSALMRRFVYSLRWATKKYSVYRVKNMTSWKESGSSNELFKSVLFWWEDDRVEQVWSHCCPKGEKNWFFLLDGGKTEYSRRELRHSDVICSTKKTIKTDQLHCDNNSFHNTHILWDFFPIVIWRWYWVKATPCNLSVFMGTAV